KGTEDNLKKKTILYQEVTAPIKAGDKLGEIKVLRDEKEIAKINLIAKNDVEQANYIKIIANLLTRFVENIMH
ncbi:MAG: D-alanyl-D-alanine carboxypeptidase, partial [archaeon]